MATVWITELKIKPFDVKTQGNCSKQTFSNKNYGNLIHQQNPLTSICESMQKINLISYKRQAKDEDASKRDLGSQGGTISYISTNGKAKTKLKWIQSLPLNYLLVKIGKFWMKWCCYDSTLNP